MPKLGYGYALYPGSASSLPSGISGLSLWLKADAGVNTIQKSTLENKLLAYWKLDTNSWLDSSGNENTLTANGGVSVVSGKINNCANFDGNPDTPVLQSLSRSNFFNFDSNNFSVSQWIYFNASGSTYYQSLFSTRVDGGATENSFSIVADSSNILTFYDGTLTTNLYTFSSSIWYHLTTTRDESTINFYINGSFVASVGKSSPYELQSISIAGNLDGSEPLNGRIDEVGVWSRTLSQAEITSLYNAGVGKSYPFDGTATTSSVTSWADQSGNGNNAVPQDTLPTLQSNAINSRPAIRNSGKSYLDSNITINPDHTIFVVAKQINSDDSYQRIIHYSLEYDQVGFFGCAATNNFATFFGDIENWYDALENTPPQSIQNYCILGCVNSNSVATPYFNGVAQDDKTGLQISANGIRMFAGTGTPGALNQNWNGDISEVIIYNRVLTTTERQQVEGYLNAKYAIY